MVTPPVEHGQNIPEWILFLTLISPYKLSLLLISFILLFGMSILGICILPILLFMNIKQVMLKKPKEDRSDYECL